MEGNLDEQRLVKLEGGKSDALERRVHACAAFPLPLYLLD